MTAFYYTRTGVCFEEESLSCGLYSGLDDIARKQVHFFLLESQHCLVRYRALLSLAVVLEDEGHARIINARAGVFLRISKEFDALVDLFLFFGKFEFSPVLTFHGAFLCVFGERIEKSDEFCCPGVFMRILDSCGYSSLEAPAQIDVSRIVESLIYLRGACKRYSRGVSGTSDVILSRTAAMKNAVEVVQQLADCYVLFGAVDRVIRDNGKGDGFKYALKSEVKRKRKGRLLGFWGVFYRRALWFSMRHN